MQSRRQFLQLLGISTLGYPATNLLPDFSAANSAINRGRALVAAPVYEAATPGSAPVTHLWPDSITPILSAHGDWYRIPQGYVPREALQPMQNFGTVGPSEMPFWAQVGGPLATVRQWCAADAPLITRIGHGGIIRVTDALHEEGLANRWYHLQSGSGESLGWSQATPWRPLRESGDPHRALKANIDLARQQLVIEQSGKTSVRAQISTTSTLKPGAYQLEARQLSRMVPGPDEPFYGVPWNLQFEHGLHASGVYWHNRFGQTTDGPPIQLPLPIAQLLYQSMMPGESLLII